MALALIALRLVVVMVILQRRVWMQVEDRIKFAGQAQQRILAIPPARAAASDAWTARTTQYLSLFQLYPNFLPLVHQRMVRCRNANQA
jgi:hypothetical protein